MVGRSVVVMAGGRSFAKRRKALQRACTALDGLDAELWQAHGADLGPLMSFIDRLGEQVDGAKVAVLREAIDRGETGKGSAGTHAWLLQWAPSYRSGGSSQLIRVVDASRDERYAQLREALVTARVPVGNAACVVEEFERIRHRLHAEAQSASHGLPRVAGGVRWAARHPRRPAASGRPVWQRRRAAGRGGPFAGAQVDVPASGRRWWPLRLPPRRRCRGEGGDRGGRRCAVGASSGRRRAGSSPLRPEAPRGAARRGAARRGLGRRGGHDDEGAAVRDHAARRSGRPGQRGDSAGVDGRGFPTGSGDGAAAGLRCRCHPGGAGQRRRGSRSRAPGAALHRGAGQGAVAAGRRLHVPWLYRARRVVRRSSPLALGRRRPERRGQRGSPVRSAPHRRAHEGLLRLGGRGAGRLGPQAGCL